MEPHDLDHRVAPARQGLAWFQQAIRMLDRNPRRLIQIACCYALLEFLPNLLGGIPAVSLLMSMLLLLLGPALTAGLLFVVGEADAGRLIEPAQLFEGLRRPGVRVQLLILGVFMLVEMLLIVLSMQRILGPGNIKILMQVADQTIKPDSAMAQAALVPMLKAMMAAMAVLFLLLTGLFFAVPRVMFDGRGAIAAIFESFSVCASNVLPLVVYGFLLMAAACGLGVGLAIVTGVLGLLGQVGAVLSELIFVAVMVVGLLVSTSGNYLAWREVFGKARSQPPSPPQAGIIV